jgi:biopolymer transport protein ExbB
MNNTTNQYLLFEILNKGGWVMYPLLACSLLAVAIILERFIWGPNRSRVIPDALLREVYSLIEGKRLQELVGVCRANTSPIARIILTALQYRKRPRSELLDLLEVAGRNEALRLQRPLGALGTIAAVSPLLGLLGTVLGMIKTFQVIELEGVGNAAALAGGISEALITTAAGLTIAIPTLVFHRFFAQKTKRLIIEMETISIQVLDRLATSNSEEDKAEEASKQAGAA